MSLHSTTDRFIEDLVKAAKESFARSPHRQPGEELHVQVSGSGGQKIAAINPENLLRHTSLHTKPKPAMPTTSPPSSPFKGKEIAPENLLRHTSLHSAKQGNHAALGAGLGGLLLPGLGAPIGAALGADEGQGLSAAGGTLLGGLGGGALGSAAGGGLGALLGLLANNPGMGATLGSAIGGGVGGIGGALYGAHRGGENPSELSQARDNGMKAAAVRFGIKEAFIGPLLGSIAGPALARAGVGALSRGAGGGALGNMAGKILPRIGGGMGGAAFDAAAGMAGSALGDKLQPRGPMG